MNIVNVKYSISVANILKNGRNMHVSATFFSYFLKFLAYLPLEPPLLPRVEPLLPRELPLPVVVPDVVVEVERWGVVVVTERWGTADVLLGRWGAADVLLERVVLLLPRCEPLKVGVRVTPVAGVFTFLLVLVLVLTFVVVPPEREVP
jgi:hypothetical protein